MGAVIVIIIVVIAMIAKGVQQANQRNQGNSRQNTADSSYRFGNSTGSSRTGSSNGPARSVGSTGSSRAGSSAGTSHPLSGKMTGSRKQTEKMRPDLKTAAGIDEDDGAILTAAKINSYVTEMDNEIDSREDLMKPVYDLMVTGPDTSIPSGRDFVAEATDMLNSFMWSDKAE